MFRPRLFPLVVLLLAGCPADDEEPDVTTPDVSGDYTVALTLVDNACIDFDYDALMAWTLDTNAARSMTLLLGQEGASLTGTTGPDVTCELLGTVGAAGTWNLSGPCDDAAMNRGIRVSATTTTSGSTHTVEGILTFEVDGVPGVDGGADGDADCEVEHRIQGTAVVGGA